MIAGLHCIHFRWIKPIPTSLQNLIFSNDGVFPIVQVTSTQNVPSLLNKSMLGTITVFGKTQLTFKGWPVYRFGADFSSTR